MCPGSHQTFLSTDSQTLQVSRHRASLFYSDSALTCLQPPGRQAGIPTKAFLRSEAEWTWPGPIPRNYKDYLFSEKEDDLQKAFNLSGSGFCPTRSQTSQVCRGQVCRLFTAQLKKLFHIKYCAHLLATEHRGPGASFSHKPSVDADCVFCSSQGTGNRHVA